jgi:hypothetical protein
VGDLDDAGEPARFVKEVVRVRGARDESDQRADPPEPGGGTVPPGSGGITEGGIGAGEGGGGCDATPTALRSASH